MLEKRGAAVDFSTAAAYYRAFFDFCRPAFKVPNICFAEWTISTPTTGNAFEIHSRNWISHLISKSITWIDIWILTDFFSSQKLPCCFVIQWCPFLRMVHKNWKLRLGHCSQGKGKLELTPTFWGSKAPWNHTLTFLAASAASPSRHALLRQLVILPELPQVILMVMEDEECNFSSPPSSYSFPKW